MKTKYPYITTYLSACGYNSVKIWWNPEYNMPEPYQTGFGPYPSEDLAIEDAKTWSENSNDPYYPENSF